MECANTVRSQHEPTGKNNVSMYTRVQIDNVWICMDLESIESYIQLYTIIYIRWFAVIYHWLTIHIYTYTPCTSLHILGDHELPGMRGAASKFFRLSLDHFHRANRVRKIGQEEMRRPQANHSKSKQIQANLGIKWRQAMQHCSKLIQSVEHFANVTSMHRKSATSYWGTRENLDNNSSESMHG